MIPMKNKLFLIILLALVSCNSETNSSRIYQEYMQLGNNSWRWLRNMDRTTFYRYNIGDTLTLNPGLRFLMIPNDTIYDIPLSNEYFYDVEQPTTVRITWLNRELFYHELYHFVTLETDSIVNGMITSEELISNLKSCEDMAYEQQSQLRRIKEEIDAYNHRISELAIKYELTEDSLFQVLAEEHYRITGTPVFGH